MREFMERFLGGLLAPDPDGGWVRAARRVLLAAAALLAAVLILGPKPWQAATGAGFFATRERSMLETILTAWWWAGALNLVLTLLLLATAGLWAAPVGRPRYPRARRAGLPGAGFLALLLLAALLAGALRWHLAHGSLWWDEAWNVKRTVVGYREPLPEEPAELAFHPVRWHWTVWHYKKPTNHVLYSVAARVSVSGWRLVGGREPWEFDEFALRLPAFAAALLSVLAVGLLVRRWVSAEAGVAAAFLLAIHPWHVEHGPELRAYGFIGLLAVAACWLLPRVLRAVAWRFLAAYAAVQLLLLWSHPFTVYFVGSMGLFGLAGLLAGSGPRRERLLRASRLAVAHLAVAMLWLQLFAPNLAQVPLWTDVLDPSRRTVGERSLAALVAFTTSGIPRSHGRDNPDLDAFPSVDRLAAEHAWAEPLIYGVLPLLALAGLVRLAARRGPERWAALGLGGAVPLAVLLAWLGQLFFHERFVFYGIVAVVVLLVAGLEGALRGAFAFSPRLRRVTVPAGLAVALLGFQALVADQTAVLLGRPYAPMREVAEYVRGAAGSNPLGAIRVGYGSGGHMPHLYDPWITQIHYGAEVAALCRRARAEATPLYVFYGYPTANRPRLPEGFRYFDDPALFEEVAHFLGADPHFSYWVLRYTGRPLPDDERGGGEGLW
jgi:hypothetical protein